MLIVGEVMLRAATRTKIPRDTPTPCCFTRKAGVTAAISTLLPVEDGRIRTTAETSEALDYSLGELLMIKVVIITSSMQTSSHQIG